MATQTPKPLNPQYFSNRKKPAAPVKSATPAAPAVPVAPKGK